MQNKIDKTIYDNFEPLEKNIIGWQGNSIVFHQLIDEVKPNFIIEVGTWYGQSAINIAGYLKNKGIEGTVFCCDTWLGACEFWTTHKDTPERNLMLKHGFPQAYYQFLSNVVHSELQDYILPFPNTSLIGDEYLKYYNKKSKLIYIDASHSYQDVLLDLMAYWPLVEEGGIIFGDDYFHWLDVQKAVVKFTTINNLTFEILENNFWVIRK